MQHFLVNAQNKSVILIGSLLTGKKGAADAAACSRYGMMKDAGHVLK